VRAAAAKILVPAPVLRGGAGPAPTLRVVLVPRRRCAAALDPAPMLRGGALVPGSTMSRTNQWVGIGMSSRDEVSLPQL
jgi:hypothetical protein